MSLKMPVIADCAVRDCAYNADAACHARAITVGDGVHPQCDTFVRMHERCDPKAPAAGVGACKVVACAHNRKLECEAPSIRVGYHDRHADCLTFAGAAASP